MINITAYPSAKIMRILPECQRVAEVYDEPHNSAADSGPHAPLNASSFRGHQFLRVPLYFFLFAIERHDGPYGGENFLGDATGLTVSRQFQGRQRTLHLGDYSGGDYYDRCAAQYDQS